MNGQNLMSTEQSQDTLASDPVDQPQAVNRWSSDLWPMLVIAIVWLLAVVIVDPCGNFPLNDDWCYARAVEVLLNQHTLRFVYVITMTLVAQVIWGALFCSLFGMSFTTLRISTLTLGLAGLLVTYKFLREVGVSRRVALIGCLVIAVNPIYFSLSNTFMTDVPFFAFAMLSLLFYARALKHGELMPIVYGTLLACIATLTRQIGVILPLAFAPAYLVGHGLRGRSILRSLTPVVIVSGTLVLYQTWLTSTGRMPLYYSQQAKTAMSIFRMDPGVLTGTLMKVLEVVLVYIGVFLLPFLILALPARSAGMSKRQWAATLGCAGVFCLILSNSLISSGKCMPLKEAPGDIIIDLGIGPATLPDVFNMYLPNYPAAPPLFWRIVTVMGVVGASLLVWHVLAAVVSAFRRRADAASDNRALLVMMVVLSCLYLAPDLPLSQSFYYDRYFLLFVPILMIVAGLNIRAPLRLKRIPIAVSMVVVLLYAVFTVGATHDYLEWNRVRWKAADDLMRTRHVPSNRIDGGTEFNGWMNYTHDFKGEWWEATTRDYMITFGPVAEYDEVARYSYRRWMLPGEGQVLILKQLYVP